MTQNEAILKYGPISNGVWANETNWCATCVIPSDIAAVWIKSATGNPTTHVYCNKDMAVQLLIALDNVKNRGLLSELKTFDGCYQVRSVRGSESQQSAHSWAMAIDVNAATNQLGTSGDMSADFAKCWTDAGFTWGRNFSRLDPMHFSMLGF